MKFTVRELTSKEIPLIVDYWTTANCEFLFKMGADIDKVPSSENITKMLTHQLNLPIQERTSFCLIWFLDGAPVGHNNTNPTSFGLEAHMHLHIWEKENRRKGLGLEFLKIAIPVFFKKLQLNKLLVEPMAGNKAPNELLKKAGFEFVSSRICIPGSLNFEQEVNVWQMKQSN